MNSVPPASAPPASVPPAPPAAPVPRRPRSVTTILAWCLLVCSFFLVSLGHLFRTAEFAWLNVTAVVQHGHELVFTTEEGEKHVLLHLSPPKGEPAWKDGDKVKLAYYRGKPQFAVLRGQEPERRSDVVEFWGLVLLTFVTPLVFFVSHYRKRRQAEAAPAVEAPGPAAKVRRSVVDWLAYAAVGPALGLAIVCAFCLMASILWLVSALLYDPDPNGVLIVATVNGVLSLLLGVALALLSRGLYRRDKRRYGLNRG